MKRFFLSLVALVAATMSYAQNTLVATLSHGESVTMYYGAFALRDAYNAAQSSDVINLSGGAFQAVDIEKGITLRGTGIDDATPTIISGNFTINIPSNDSNRLSMEGIRCTSKIIMEGTFNSPYFVKCQFASIDIGFVKNVMFANCRITSTTYLYGPSTALFINCYVCGLNNDREESSISLYNCIIEPFQQTDIHRIYRSHLLNCIIYQNDYSLNYDNNFGDLTIATNCISIGFENPFGNIAANIGNFVLGYDEFSNVFKSFSGTYSDNELFELTEQAKAQYIGNDNTEIGLHGGFLPYDTTPSYPQIKMMNVAKKTTADGKLSVEIEVSAAE